MAGILEKITCLMDNFEKQFENVHAQLNVMDDAMSQTNATNAPRHVVEALMTNPPKCLEY